MRMPHCSIGEQFGDLDVSMARLIGPQLTVGRGGGQMARAATFNYGYFQMDLNIIT